MHSLDESGALLFGRLESSHQFVSQAQCSEAVGAPIGFRSDLYQAGPAAVHITAAVVDCTGSHLFSRWCICSVGSQRHPVDRRATAASGGDVGSRRAGGVHRSTVAWSRCIYQFIASHYIGDDSVLLRALDFSFSYPLFVI